MTSDSRVELAHSVKTLFTIWVVLGAILLIIFLPQVALSHFPGKHLGIAIKWLTDALLLPFSVILAARIRQIPAKTAYTSTTKHSVNKWLSIIYLLLITLPYVLQPFITPDPTEVLEDFWLVISAFQAILLGTLVDLILTTSDDRSQ